MTIREYLEENKMSRRAFAKVSGVNTASISLFLSGQANLSARNVEKLKRLGIDTTDEIIIPNGEECFHQSFIESYKPYIEKKREGIVYAFNPKQVDDLVEYILTKNKKYCISKTDFCWSIEFKPKLEQKL